MKTNNELTRRHFIESLAFSTLGVSLLKNYSFANSSQKGENFGKAKRAIYIYFNGGASHIDTFDPKTHKDISTGIKGISTTGEFQISEYFPKLAKFGEYFCPIRSLNSQTGAHAPGQYLVRTSYNKNSLTVHPTMGALSYWLLGSQHDSIPDNILISGDTDHSKGGYLDKKYYPLEIVNPNEGLRYAKQSVSDQIHSKRLEILKSFNSGFEKDFNLPNISAYNTFYDETIKIMSSEDLELFDLNKENKEVREKYGMTQFGQGLLLAKRLIKNNVRFVEVDTGGFDMHTDINDRMTSKAAELDTALSALFADLISEGLIDDTLIIIATEFGRTPNVNVNSGRDHWPSAFSGVLGGAGFGGISYGKTDDKGMKVVENPVSIGSFNATIGHLLGIEHTHVWVSDKGRPFTTGNNQKPIDMFI